MQGDGGCTNPHRRKRWHAEEELNHELAHELVNMDRLRGHAEEEASHKLIYGDGGCNKLHKKRWHFEEEPSHELIHGGNWHAEEANH